MIWLFFILLFIVLGISSWEKIFPKRSVIETILIGSLFGMILSSVLPFLFGLIISFDNAVLVSIATALIASSVIIFIDWKNWKEKINEIKLKLKNPDKSFKITAVVFILILIPYLFLISKVLFTDGNGWLTTGFRSAYGDVPFHMMYINSFSFGDNFPVQNPDFSTTPSNYPFLPFFTSSAIISLGASPISGFLAPLFILGTIIIGLLFFVPLQITKNPWASFLVPVLFLLSGGLGFIYFFKAHGFDVFSLTRVFSNVVVDEATNIPTAGINLMNVLVSSILPQRGVFFGLPIFLAIILLWFSKTDRAIIASAILMAFLPLLHAHTFITLVLIAPFFVFQLWTTKKFFLRPWILFCVIVFCASFPVLLFFHPNLGQSANFIHFSLGWMAGKTGIFGIILYWIKNLGFFLFAVALAFIPGIIPKELKLWYLPFLPIFFIANFVMFSTWDFDNHKLFNLWYLASSFLVAYLLAVLFKKRFILSRAFATILLVLIILSGSIDTARLFLFSKNGFKLFSPEAQELGNFLKNNTPPDSIFVASTSHISPVVLSGRKRFLGYTGWLWSRGIDFKDRLKKEEAIFFGGDQSKTLIKENEIDYLLIGTQELNEFLVNRTFFEENYKEVYNKNGYQVFSLK